MQEKPEDLPPGQLPRVLAVKLIGDEIVDVARPGDHVSIVGIVRAFAPSLMGMGKLRTFILQLDANSIEVLGKEPETSPPTPEEEAKIVELSKDPLVHKKIMTSIAPSIFGNEHLKEAVMYLLFGGVSRSLPDVTIRGEMNALIIGDPGTAKSQMLQYVARIAPRGLYTSGRVPPRRLNGSSRPRERRKHVAGSRSAGTQLTRELRVSTKWTKCALRTVLLSTKLWNNILSQ